MIRTWSFLAAFGVAVSAWSTTPQQAAQRWAQFAPGMNGKVVYGQDTGQNGKIWVLDLKLGTTTSIHSYAMGTTAYGTSCSFRWSPSGNRIMTNNPDSINVLNADGTNMKRIATVHQCADLIWGDWSGDSSVVYSTGTGKTVVRTAVHTDNSPGATSVLVSNAPIGPCWSSVGIDSNWLSYNDVQGNSSTGGYHRPMLKNLNTGIVKTLVADSQDMCQLTMIPDPTRQYKTLGQMSSHLVPGTICDTNGNHVATLPRIGAYPQRAYSWSNQLEYFMCQGENTSQTWAWIRSWSNRATSANILISNDSNGVVMYYPDLYVTPLAATSPGFSIHQAEIPKNIDIAFYAKMNSAGFSVYTISGSKVDFRAGRAVPAGIYLVKVPGAATGVNIRYLTVK
jgi:hypothetical protein